MIFSNETTGAVAKSSESGYVTTGGTVLTSLGKVMGVSKGKKSAYLSGKQRAPGKQVRDLVMNDTSLSTIAEMETQVGETEVTPPEKTVWDYDSDADETVYKDATTGTQVSHRSSKGSNGKGGTDEDVEMRDRDHAKLAPKTGDTKWTTVTRKRNSTVIYATESMDTRIQDTPREVMKRRGDVAIEPSTNKDTPVSVEFKIPPTTASFNLRDAIGNLLTVMLKGDASVKFGNNEGTDAWNDPNELPVGEALTKQMHARHDTPPYETPKVTVFFNIKSSKTVNDIKYQPTVINYLKNLNIFLRPDRYDNSRIRSPGYFVRVPPRLLWKQTFLEELKRGVDKTKFDLTEEIYKNYFRENGFDKEPTKMPLPKFHVYTSTRKFGQVAAEVLKVDCAEKDALYLKKLLSTMGEQGTFSRGQFIPTGLHLIAGPSVVVNLLRNQNSYMDTITAVAVEGITQEAMLAPRYDLPNGAKGTLMQRIKFDVNGIQSIEPTANTAEKGKWFVVVKKSHADAFHEYLDTTLQALLNQPEDLLEGFKGPRRAGAHKTVEILGSYADMLKKSVLPTNGHRSNQFDQPKARPTKRAMKDINFTQDSETTASGSSPLFTQPHSLGYGMSQTTAPALDVDALEKKLLTSLEEKMEKSIDVKFQDMTKTFEAELKQNMNSMAQSIEDNITGMLKESLADLTNTMTISLKDQVGTFLNEVQGKLAMPTTTSGLKRSHDQVITPTPKPEGVIIAHNGQGSHNNATSIEPRKLDDAMKE